MTADAPRFSRRRAALTVAAGLLPAGALVGGLWGWLAPPVRGVVVLTHTGERLHEYLGPESDHFFVAAFLMLGMLNVVAAVAAVLVWQWRAHRGPGMVAALCSGMAIADAAAIGTGVLVAHLRHSTVDFAAIPLKPDQLHYFIQAPPVFFGPSTLQMACTLLLPAATAALVYATPAAATARDDLGAQPPVEAVYPPSDSATAPTS